jgi:hypothetical protein
MHQNRTIELVIIKEERPTEFLIIDHDSIDHVAYGSIQTFDREPKLQPNPVRMIHVVIVPLSHVSALGLLDTDVAELAESLLGFNWDLNIPESLVRIRHLNLRDVRIIRLVDDHELLIRMTLEQKTIDRLTQKLIAILGDTKTGH